MSNILKKIIIITIAFFFIHSLSFSSTDDSTFDQWLNSYKKFALKKGISLDTINRAFKNVRYLEQVIKYDRKQPEFYEDTITYVNKRANKSRALKASQLFKKNKRLFYKVENEFKVEKEILLALWGIETNFGKYVGKMDIISSLSTLSYDMRRRDFFSKQLLNLLKLIDKGLINPSNYYGSWAGAYGNFQFMPSTINSYAIDYDKNNKIELIKSLEDSLASAANYINKIGWRKGEPCFYRVRSNKKINNKYINKSAKKLSNKLKIKQWINKGIVHMDGSDIKTNFKAALIMPDGKENSPMYLVFSNYEKILKWNRSLRFGISVCKLSQMIKT